MTIALSIATRGHEIIPQTEGGGVGPDRPCILLDRVQGNSARFVVSPPPDFDYAGTIIQYNSVGSCSDYSEAGPEDPSFLIDIAGLTAGTIYVFTPYAYDVEGNLGKPGNPVLATVPINIIDMPDLSLNSCSLELVWRMITSKVDASELTAALKAADTQLTQLTRERDAMQDRIRRLEAEVRILREKI